MTTQLAEAKRANTAVAGKIERPLARSVAAATTPSVAPSLAPLFAPLYDRSIAPEPLGVRWRISPARGVLLAVLLAVPFWMLIAGAVYALN